MIISPPTRPGLESHSLFLSLTERRRQPGKLCNLTINFPEEKSLERSSPGPVPVPAHLSLLRQSQAGRRAGAGGQPA